MWTAEAIHFSGALPCLSSVRRHRSDAGVVCRACSQLPPQEERKHALALCFLMQGVFEVSCVALDGSTRRVLAQRRAFVEVVS